MSEVFWADGRSDEFKEGYALGYHDGSKDDTSPILTDLIAQLRGLHTNGDYYYSVPVDVLLDRAEARLREVTGDDE